MRALLVLALATSLLATALPAAAADVPAPSWFARVVQPGDADTLLNLQTTIVKPLFLDANGNAIPDSADPDEPWYLDLDNSGAVSFGDLHLTAAFSYPAGTAVDFLNRDAGRTLATNGAWFARTSAAAWYVDADSSRVVSPGDVRMTGDQAGTKVRVGDADAGGALTAVQDTITPALRIGWNDVNGNQRRDLDEPVYIDVNTDRQVSPGELRIRENGLAVDNTATKEEVAAAVAATVAQMQREMQAGDQANAQAAQAGDASLAAQLQTLADDFASTSQLLMILALVTLVGLVAVAWYARNLFQHAAQPRAAPEPAQQDLQGFR